MTIMAHLLVSPLGISWHHEAPCTSMTENKVTRSGCKTPGRLPPSLTHCCALVWLVALPQDVAVSLLVTRAPWRHGIYARRWWEGVRVSGTLNLRRELRPSWGKVSTTPPAKWRHLGPLAPLRSCLTVYGFSSSPEKAEGVCQAALTYHRLVISSCGHFNSAKQATANSFTCN